MKENISTYLKKIISLVFEICDNDFSTSKAGHCMKITGLGLNELEYLWSLVNQKYPDIATYIVSEESVGEKYISATKLIELRNNQDSALLVLIPSNSRTAAEDSYGNATFKEISLEGIEQRLMNSLICQIPTDYSSVIKDEILGYLNSYGISIENIIRYLIALEENGYNNENIGNFIYLLKLIPDSILLSEKDKLRSRLKFNIESTQALCAFNIPQYDRISNLPLEPNTLQKKLIKFLKIEHNARSIEVICTLIYNKYKDLNYSCWSIPNLDFTHIELITENIKSKHIKIEDGIKVLEVEENKKNEVIIRFRTNPCPKDVADLKFFRIILMAVDGANGYQITELRKLKNTTTNRAYKDVKVELNPNVIEEGSYFFKVSAEDEFGNILNKNDKFKDSHIQKAWSEACELDPNTDKSNFPYKLSCDSDDFYFSIEESVESNENQRKDKLNNVLQAYFKYNIHNLKNSHDIDNPIPSEDSNKWIEENKKYTSIYYINYSEKHNFQVEISNKLRIIESAFLNNSGSFGYVKAAISSNPIAIGFESIDFVVSRVDNLIPIQIKTLRKKCFDAIKGSNKTLNGIFETADLFNHIDVIKKYLIELTEWSNILRARLNNKEISDEEKTEIISLFTELQFLDFVKMKTYLPDGQRVEAILLSPLHPLRLAWSAGLKELFDYWMQKSLEYPNHISCWNGNLESIFEGKISPENSPLVILDPNNMNVFHYSGELSHGWGVYFNAISQESTNAMTSVSRQLKYYLRQLFNISNSNYVETDISLKLVIRHIKNYLSQHPYTDQLIINLFNSGDAAVFADAFVELEKEKSLKDIKYEVRIFRGEDKIIEHGEALKDLLNPESNITEEAEVFSQPSKNRLFPKLRFSINNLCDYLKTPTQYTAHLSFLVSPFPVTVELFRPYKCNRNFYLNGLITSSTVDYDETQTKWNRYIKGNVLPINYGDIGKLSVNFFDNLQAFISCSLASNITDSIPSTQLRLNDNDVVLLSHLHDYSDWVITFDKNVGPQIYDQPSKDGKIPFLLDYIPGEELSDISSYLTTRPSSEILGLLGPHFKEFDLDIYDNDDKVKIQQLLEDLRAVSSSLVLQLNSSKNKAFEVIGSAFTKRVLEKKGFLEEAFLVPIDLHQNLFENLPSGSKSRADNLLININPERQEICITIIEIKCRKFIGDTERFELKMKMQEQIYNTKEALCLHFDPEYNISVDRLDREIKNKEFKALLTFYLERAYRYNYLSENAYQTFLNFLDKLDCGFKLKYKHLGIIYDFSAEKKHYKEILNDDITFFTFGHKLITEILDPDSDLNTKRLEDLDLDTELADAVSPRFKLGKFIQSFTTLKGVNTETSITDKKEFEALADGIKADNVPTYSDTVNHEEETSAYDPIILSTEKSNNNISHIVPSFDILIGKSSESNQFGVLAESISGKKIAIDLSETNTISLFGIQGGGKSYTIGTVSEMVLKQFSNVNLLPSPLAGVIFHFSESMDYEPEFTSMINSNDSISELTKLKEKYGAEPDSINDIIILTPNDKLEERQAEFPSIKVQPIAFNSNELSVQDWLFLLGAVGNESTYIKQLKSIMKDHRKNITIDGLTESVEESELLTNTQKALARQKLSFAREYIDDNLSLKNALKPGRLIIVDLRDEFIVKDEALGLFVIMLNVFSSVKQYDGVHFNKFIVFDEAHKYMDNKELTGNIVTAIREMRHKGVSIMIASQDPPSLPNEIIELSSIVLLHKFNSPQWLKHIQKSIIQLSSLTPADMSALSTGEGFLWATKATEKSITTKPLKVSTRPRVTKHGGVTIKATGCK